MSNPNIEIKNDYTVKELVADLKRMMVNTGADYVAVNFDLEDGTSLHCSLLDDSQSDD